MHNFKAGDEAILVSVEPHWKVQVGTKVRVHKPTVGGAGPGYYVELSTQPGSTRYYAEHRLGPVDDPLPPAPESVLYREASTGTTLSARTREWDNTVEVWSGDRGGSVCLSADEAMQLAHDLTRMAMEIKRKEKAGGYGA